MDHEVESSLILYLDAIDGGGEQTRFLINIEIDDVNDLAPEFEHENYHFITNIQSSTTSFHSTIIGQVHANDRDSSTKLLTYSLNSTLFRINSRTGQLTLIEPLPSNLTDQSMFVNVSVHDGLHSTQTQVHISIEGINHRPFFENDQFHFQIHENLPIRTVIGQITAKDNDLPNTRRGELTYSLQPITSHSEFFFHITHNGQIILTRIPDAEQQQLHQFIVLVKDHGENFSLVFLCLISPLNLFRYSTIV